MKKSMKEWLKSAGISAAVAAPILIVGTALSAPVLPLIGGAAAVGGLVSGVLGYKWAAAAARRKANDNSIIKPEPPSPKPPTAG
ncbi:MAG: hypothetical protein HY052_01510 [Proteobacteria bacterium]|nr:hypothetical protein [Pseudomonadota bacterium]